MAESTFVGALTEDIALLSSDDDAPAESDVSQPSSFSGTEATDTRDEKGIQKQAEENKPYDADKSPLNNSRPTPTPQNFEPPSDQEKAALDSGLMEFCRDEITAALPQLRPMDSGEREQLIGRVNAGILQEIHADKRFMASLEKSYDGSRQSLQRGMLLLAEKWLRTLPHAIGKLNLPKPLTQSDANNMQPMEILNSTKFGQKSKPWRPEYIFDVIGRSRPRAAGARR